MSPVRCHGSCPPSSTPSCILKPEPVEWIDEDERERIQVERAARKNSRNELYYCYSLRRKEPHPKDARGELMYGVRLGDDGHLRTHCYGKEQLKDALRPGWEVVGAKLPLECKPQAPLP